MPGMTDPELLHLHRALVGVPSLSGREENVSGFLTSFLCERGVEVMREGNNLAAVFGEGPVLCFNSHLDTVPPAPGWTREPFRAEVVDGRVYGLGSNDAKASVAAMIAAFLRLREGGAPLRVLLTLAVEEETGGKGTETLLPALARRGLRPDAAVVGEPTGLEIAVAQKGLMVLELWARGEACHAAHARKLHAPNALRLLARDLVAIEEVYLGPDHPLLGPVTLEPTMASGGTARNMVAAEASCILDARINPGEEPSALAGRLQEVVRGELRVVSERLRPFEVDPGSPIVKAARRAGPASGLFGSAGLSDLVFFSGTPAIKVGPGRSERSHTADEMVLEREIVEGAAFYERLAREYADETRAARGATG